MLPNAHKASGFCELLGDVRRVCMRTRKAENSDWGSDLARQT